MPEVRMLVGLNRTGTSAFLNAMVQNDKQVYGVYEPIEWGTKANGRNPDGSFRQTDYSIFDGTHDAFRQKPGVPFYVFKESIGGSRVSHDYPLFHNDAAIMASRPIIIFRNPLTQWGGWLRAHAPRRPSLEKYIAAYKYLYDLYKGLEAKFPQSVKVLTFEKMIGQPQAVFQEVCRFWGIPFDPAMVAQKWKIQFKDAIAGHRNIYLPQVDGLVNADPVWRAELSASEGFAVPRSMQDPEKANEMVTEADKADITRELGSLYQEIAAQADRDFPVAAKEIAVA